MIQEMLNINKFIKQCGYKQNNINAERVKITVQLR